MAKSGQKPPAKTGKKQTEIEHRVAKGGKTRASSPRSGRSGSDSNRGNQTRGH